MKQSPQGWTEQTLGSVLRKIAIPVSVQPDGEYREIGIRSHGKGIFHKPAVSGASLGEKRVFQVVPDALVLNIVFAWEQAVATTTESESGMIASHRFPMYQALDNQCDVKFLRYFFCTQRGKDLLELASPGGAGRNKTLGQNAFEKLRISMPDCVEQQRIAVILNTWDRAIAISEELIENSKIKKQMLMQRLFFAHQSNHEPGRKTIGDLAYIDASSLTKTTPDDFQFRYITLSDITEHHVSQDLATYQVSTAPSRARRIVRPGDLLMSTVRPNLQGFARVTRAHIDCIASTGFAVLTAKPEVSADYLFHYLFSKDIQDQINAIVTGSSYPSINSSDVERLSVQCPSLEQQRAIAKILDVADEKIRTEMRKRDILIQEKQALMQQLLTGKRRVVIDDDHQMDQTDMARSTPFSRKREKGRGRPA